MPLLTKNNTLSGEHHQRLDNESAIPAEGLYLIPLNRWIEESVSAEQHPRLAIEFNPDSDSLDKLLPLASQQSLIAIHFSAFRDGRGFSVATLLRRAGYTGELLATGDVTYDQLAYMKRCGFDCFLINDKITPEIAKAAFDEISVVYQSAADQKPPVYHQGA